MTLAATLALAGCATMPPPDAAMNQAQAQLQAARDAGAADYAPVDLGFAQVKLQAAQAAMADRKYADAANLAEESRTDAELARAKAQLGNARAQIQAKTRANALLRQQIDQSVNAASRPAPATSAAAPAASAAAPAVLQDMPAPSASVLSAPLPQAQDLRQGFQPSSAASAPTPPASPATSPARPTDGGQP